ncbi:hemerythrin domain-containing protein [Devosia faecipullorum]|uniref:hemerythrin domain-containing protein n=1 Tax=Devosia faecipullorum TaxID=2755039 RepID=UPI00187B479E|nr:hemerythrin domain-containing protein [Devosia faecipullorum]MBE7733551.1 hemerythrin domain-containing protein [Devosia faecipullorum]
MITEQPEGMQALLECYSGLLHVCDQLEAIADGLPDSFGIERSTWVADQLLPLLARAHEEEERVLLPLIGLSGHPQVRNLVNRLRHEHQVDEAAALDITETLLALGAGRPLLPPEATGYQLRSFFESVRRHVQAEQDMLFLLDNFTIDAKAKT